MSRFKTAIPVDVEAVKRMLPPGTYFHGVTWDPATQTLALEWEHDKVTSPYTFAADFPLAALEGKEQQPKYVKVLPGLGGRGDQGPATPPQDTPGKPPVTIETIPAEEHAPETIPAAAGEQSEAAPGGAVAGSAATDNVLTPAKESVEKPKRRR